jgi:hypothetical protein
MRSTVDRLGLAAAEFLLDRVGRLVGSCSPRLRCEAATLIGAVLARTRPRLFRQAATNLGVVLDVDACDPRVRRLARATIQSFVWMALDFLWLRTADPAEVVGATTVIGWRAATNGTEPQP